VALALLAGTIALTQTNAVYADNVCKFTKENQRCDVDIEKVNGGFKLSIVNEQNNSGGGGANATDSVARAGVDELKAADVNQNSQIDSLTSENQALRQNASDAATQINSLSTQVSTLNDDVATLKAQVANLTSLNPVVGIQLSNGSTPVGNNTGNGTN